MSDEKQQLNQSDYIIEVEHHNLILTNKLIEFYEAKIEMLNLKIIELEKGNQTIPPPYNPVIPKPAIRTPSELRAIIERRHAIKISPAPEEVNS